MNSKIGFRLNGVNRGGCFNVYGSASLGRSGRRYSFNAGLSLRDGVIGFRAVGEWCNKTSV